MGLLSIIKQWLYASPRTRQAKAHPDLYPIDIQIISKELQLEIKAKELGLAELPDQDSKVLSGPENQIVQKIEKVRQDYIDWAALRLSVINEDLSRVNFDQKATQFSQMSTEFDREAAQILTDSKPVLTEQFNNRQSAKRDLDKFKESHKLERDAHYKEGAQVFLSYAILLFLIVVEGLINAHFFAQGVDTGLLGGFLFAGLFALINVSVSFLIGKNFVRYYNHNDASKSFFGTVSIVLGMLITVAVALMVAHYRDALIAEVMDPQQAVLVSIQAHPFQLHDISSWLLAALTVFFGIGSIVDGYFLDDPYPKFGKITRKCKQAAADYDDEEAFIRDQLDELKDEKLEKLELILSEIQADINVFDGLLETKKTSKIKLNGALANADNALNSLLTIFRNENEKHRESDVPAYFNELPKLKDLDFPVFENRGEKPKLKSFNKKYESLLKSLPELRERIQKAYDENYSHEPISKIVIGQKA